MARQRISARVMRVLGTSTILLLASCSDHEQACVPGRVVSCPCGDGRDGVQSCNDDGTRFDACRCDDPMLSPQDDAGADSGGAAGSSSGGEGGTSGGAGGITAAGQSGGASGVSGGSGGSSSPTPSGPAQLALQQEGPTGIAVWGGELYWANEDAGMILHCSTTACPEDGPAIVVSGLSSPRGVAADELFLYWIDASADGTAFTLQRCERESCTTPETLLSRPTVGTQVAIGAGFLWIGAWTELIRCPIDDCSDDSGIAFVTGSGITGVAANDDYVFFARNAEHEIQRCPADDCGPDESDRLQILSGFAGVITIALDDGRVYWTDGDYYESTQDGTRGRIDHCPDSGCAPYAPSTASSGDILPWGVALDPDNFYWTDHDRGQVTRTPRPFSG